MADTSENSPTNDWPPTALSNWLIRSKKTANKLATDLGITPRSVYALARGGSDLLATKTLISVSNYTGISIDDLVRPYYNSELTMDAGDSRFNTMLAKIGLHMHSNRCNEKLARYISPSFRCGGSEYTKKKQVPMTFDEMCVANASNSYDIKSVLIASYWYNVGTTRPTQSRTLHTYWRGLITDGEAQTTTDTTFVVFEVEKSIEEMEATETYPRITNWWWHRPTELHVEFSERRPNGWDNAENTHRKMADEQFMTRVREQHLTSTQFGD